MLMWWRLFHQEFEVKFYSSVAYGKKSFSQSNQAFSCSFSSLSEFWYVTLSLKAKEKLT